MHGLLLANLGTPDAPTTPAVRRYLRQFLSDPRVIDIPAILGHTLFRATFKPTATGTASTSASCQRTPEVR